MATLNRQLTKQELDERVSAGAIPHRNANKQVRITVNYRSGRGAIFTIPSPDETATEMAWRVSGELSNSKNTVLYISGSLVVIDSAEEILYEDVE